MIVKHHIEGLKNDQITISKSDSLQSAVSWNADSPAETPTVTSGTETENNTAFVISKQIKSRYFLIVVFDTLFCAVLTFWFEHI